MSVHDLNAPATLTCHRCDYDLRAQPADGRCPECGTPVADSVRESASPVRPRWHESDQRWRRSIIAGLWVLVGMSLISVLRAYGVLSQIPFPSLLHAYHPDSTLRDTLLFDTRLHVDLLFGIGVTLLFAVETGRRRSRLEWTRRWGLFMTAIAVFINVSGLTLIVGLVTVGVSAVFYGMPLRNQPPITPSLIDIGAGMLYYLPQPGRASEVVVVIAASLAVLLACVPLGNALRSTFPNPRRVRFLVLLPLAGLAIPALWHLAEIAHHGYEQITFTPPATGLTFGPYSDAILHNSFFLPELLSNPRFFGRQQSGPRVVGEHVKFVTVLAMAIWLTTAQILARRRRAAGGNEKGADTVTPRG
jgi:hypothetical protein